jgi:hypothetical protein
MAVLKKDGVCVGGIPDLKRNENQAGVRVSRQLLCGWIHKLKYVQGDTDFTHILFSLASQALVLGIDGSRGGG